MAPARSFALHRFLVPFFAFVPLIGFGLTADRSARVIPPHGDKPMFPVATTLSVGDVPPGAGVVRVVASVTAWSPGEVVEWSLTLPAGLKLVGGAARWTGVLERGQTRQFELQIDVPDGAPHELYAQARLADHPRATAGASAVIDAGPLDAAPATLEVGVGGEDYIQYRGEVRAQ